jgi:8-hydroxy-5-deazaflavin:NADPH oxidoreductase
VQLAIIGAGNVGNALATGWLRAGHSITFGVRNPGAMQSAGIAGAQYADVTAVAQGASVIALAVPWSAVPEVLAAAGDLRGKVLVDCTNPLTMGANGLELEIGHRTSGGEEVAALAPDAAVFKTLNQTGFDNMMQAGSFAPVRAAMFVAGDDAAQKPVVMGLVSDLGFEAIDAGPLRIARLLEPMAMLWIHMALNHGMPVTQAFAVARRT